MIESDKDMDASFSLAKLYNFSGKLLFFKLNGNFSDGYLYRDGHIKATMTSTRPNLQSLNTDIMAGNGKISGRKPPTCVTHMVTTGSTTCITVGDYTNCTWQTSGYAFYTICDDGTEYGDNTDPNNNNDGGGVRGGGTPKPREILLDTSITSNTKINCLMEKLLGRNGQTATPEFTALLDAFKAKGYDVTFKIGTTDDSNSKAETSPDADNPTKYNIVLNKNKINSESQMSWVKTMLHEAFHANLMQKSYEMFGSHAVGLWAIGPKDMTLPELMDKIENLLQPTPTLAQQHHEFMAMNINIIKNGLKSFSLTNNTEHANFDDNHFTALAYESLHETSYYLNKIVKDASGNDIMVAYNGGIYALNAVHTNRARALEAGSVTPCN